MEGSEDEEEEKKKDKDEEDDEEEKDVGYYSCKDLIIKMYFKYYISKSA